MKIALTGNPNCGKTTLFNKVTGSNASVGNWSGVTVEKKEAQLKKKYNSSNKEVTIVDLPGAYSISPYTSEESITKDYIMDENPDVIVNIVDGANLSRSLFFTTQLLELGIPVVVAINKYDIVEKRKDQVDIKKLERALNCPVLFTSATSDVGLEDVFRESIKTVESKRNQNPSTLTLKDKNNEDKERQQYIDQLVDASIIKTRDASKVSFSDKLDRVVAHQFLGIPIFFGIMYVVFWFSQKGLGGYLSGYLNDTFFGEIVPTATTNFLTSIGVEGLLQALIVDGIIGGVGAVLGFLPLIMVLFFCLSLLEDCGYMARVAVLLDRYFKKIGLSGKSIIPMIVGSGCAIPGVMATRTIEDVNEKRMTTILTPFIPCGAKLPIIALIVAAFFPNYAWVGPSMYLLSFVVILTSGLLLKRLFVWENNSQFIMELPEYKLPSLKHAVYQMFDKAKGFIVKASTIILVCNTAVWFTQTYGWNLQPVVDQSDSILASIGGVVAFLLIPLGFVGWQLGAAALTGFIAKENVVGTLAVILLVSEDALSAPGGALTTLFAGSSVLAFSYLIFNLFTPPCFAAMGAMNSEMGSRKWLLRGITFQFFVGYTMAMLVSQIGTIVMYGYVLDSFIPAVAVFIALTTYVVLTIKKVDKENKNNQLATNKI